MFTLSGDGFALQMTFVIFVMKNEVSPVLWLSISKHEHDTPFLVLNIFLYND